MTDDRVYSFSAEKNAALKKHRNISFEEIIFALEHEGALEIIDNASHAGERIYIVRLANYVYMVPFIEMDKEIRLKTIYPSRKMKKKYMQEDKI